MKNKRLVVVHSPNSTAAIRYEEYVKPELEGLKIPIREVSLENLPYFDSRKLIAGILEDGDLVIAAGGDGISNVTADACLESQKDIVFAVVPLGNFNDFSHTVNGSMKDPLAVLSGQVLDFYPLDLSINGEHSLYAIQYVTFGASAELTEFLNSPSARDLRRKVRGNSALFGTLCVLNYKKIFKGLGGVDKLATIMPDFTRNGKVYHYNNIGFMLGGIGAYFHPKAGNFSLVDQQFWFHHATLTGKAARDVPYLASWFGRNIPGEVSTLEEINFDKPADIVSQVGGDKIILEKVKKISCQRSKKPLRTLMPNAHNLLR